MNKIKQQLYSKAHTLNRLNKLNNKLDYYLDGFNNGGGDYNQRMGGRQSGGRMRGNMGSRGNQAGRNRPY